MNSITQITLAIIASSGLWTFISTMVSRRLDRKDAKSKLLLGLAHDRIIELGMIYIDRGYITKDEFENLHDYLYKPYEEMGGNGTAKKVVEDCKHLPIKE